MGEQYCTGCERSVTELMQEYNDYTKHFNKKFKTNDPIMNDPEEVFEQPEIVFTNSGNWYCHTDCLRDCY